MKNFAALVLLLVPAVPVKAGEACGRISAEIAAAAQALADNKPDAAEQTLLPLRPSSGDCAQIVLLLGRTRAAQGMPVLARNLLTEYIQRVPSDPAGQIALAQLLLQQNDYDEAAKSIATALRLGPDNLEALLFEARLFEAQHRDDEAQRVLMHACELKPGNAEAQFQLGALFDSRHRSAEAVGAFRKVVQLEPANASAWDYLALNLEAEGEQAQAERAYTAGLRVNRGPRVDRFLDYNYGRFLMKWNRLTESETWLNRAAEAAPETRAVYYERAKLYLLCSKYSEARADAERALRLPDPGQYVQDVQVYSVLAAVYQHLGDTQQAHSFAALARATKLKGGSGGRQ